MNNTPNIQTTLSFSGCPVFFDGDPSRVNSLGILDKNLIINLRRQGIPAYGLAHNYVRPQSQHLTRQLSIAPPIVHDTNSPEYIYIDNSGIAARQLALTSKQTIAISAIDDFRWKFPHVKHSWKAYDNILTFSRFGQQYLQKALKRTVDYFPLGVDTSIFHPTHIRQVPDFGRPKLKNFAAPVQSIINTSRVFLFVSFLQERKGVKHLLKAYYKAYYGVPSVLLWLHGPDGWWATKPAHEEMKLFKNPQAPALLWTEKELTEQELNDIYNCADTYVTPHHLEGFGLGGLQAIACGLPVISTKYAGPMDYLSHPSLKNSVHFVDVKETTINYPRLGKIPWGEYKIDSLAQALTLSLPPAKPRNLSTFSWRNSAKVLTSHLDHPGKIIQAGSKGGSEVTICILCREASDDLECLLDSMDKINPGLLHNTIIVNDGWDEKVSTIINIKGKEEVIIEKSRGISFARNVAIQRVDSHYMVFLDCDTVVTTQNWLLDWLTSHQRHNAAVSGILQFYPDGKVNCSGHDIIGMSCPRFQLLPTLECYRTKSVPYVQGSAMMINTHIAQDIGFHEGFTVYYDDADFCTMVRQNNHKVMYLPVTSLIHKSKSIIRNLGIEAAKNDGCELFNTIWRGIIPAY